MNYNPNPGLRNRKWENSQGPGRKVKRVSDVNAMGPTAPMPNASPYMQPGPQISNPYDPMLSGGTGGGMGGYGVAPQPGNLSGYPGGSGVNMPASPQAFNYNPPHNQQQPQGFQSTPSNQVQGQFVDAGSGVAGSGGQFPNTIPPFTMLQQPIVQDMAMQYGQRLADQGKQLMENQLEKWVPVAKLKYYFAVDNNYVIKKLRLLFFPFTHKDWALKYDQENPVQPRYDINAPDLYIPTMAYITYVVVAGLMLGLQNRFTPEQLGIQASSALAYNIFELLVYAITLYVVNIKTSLKTLDLLAFAGYKFVIIVACLLVSTLFHATGYYSMLIYSSLALGFFLLRTLKTKVLHDGTPASTTGAINYDPYGNPQQLDYSGGRKRKLYFLFLIVGGQFFFSFLLSKHLYFPDAATLEARNLKF